MKTGITIFSIMVIAGLLIGLVLPAGQAWASPHQDPANAFVFHVLPNETNGSQALASIPADAEDIIVVQGTNHVTQTQARFANLCSLTELPVGTPSPTPSPSPTPTGTLTPSECQEALDIYYEISWTVNWDSGLREDCSIWGVCERNVSPLVDYEYGGSNNVETGSWGKCGEAGQASGTCTFTLKGTIPAADIGHAITGLGDFWNERLLVKYSDYWGGTEFNTEYRITLSFQPLTSSCSDQYLLGAALGSFTLSSTWSSGVYLQQALGLNVPSAGSWYAIKVTAGSWKNNGTGGNLRSLAIKNGISGTWYPLEDDTSVGCADGASDTYYAQMGTLATYLRAGDTDGNFAANTGAMTITIYGISAYTPYPSGCELLYGIGDLIEQRNINAEWENGWPLAGSKKVWNPTMLAGAASYTRYYMLETIGGPAYLGGTEYTWDADLGKRATKDSTTPDTWYDIQSAPFVTCAREIDPVGHVRVFFPHDEQLLGAIIQYYYSIRVQDDGSYSDNNGTLGYRLYEATYMQDTPPGENPPPNGCQNYDHVAEPTASIVIQGNSETGTDLPTLTNRAIYALDVVDGPWKDNGDDSYAVEISDDDGTTWTDLKDYPYLLCAASVDGDHVIIYVFGASGKHWVARADDQDTNFSNNTLSIGMDIYAGHSIKNPWQDCLKRYTLSKVPLTDIQRSIAGTSSSGINVPGIVKGNIFAIEITDEAKWYEGISLTGFYTTDIYDAIFGTGEWQPIEEYTPVLCVEQLGDGDRYKIYFTAQSNTYTLRVRDEDGDFPSNRGEVRFNLYTALDNDDPNPPPKPPPAEWQVACNEKYTRPDGFIGWYPVSILGADISLPLPRVGEWLDYLRNSITFYFAWCPQHTEALKSIGEVAANKEPLASIQDFIEFLQNLREIIKKYQTENLQLTSGGDSGLTSQEPYLFSDTQNIGATSGGDHYNTTNGTGPWDLFLPFTLDPATNIWYGGQLDMTASLNSYDATLMAGYQTICSDKFYPLLGITTDPFCQLMSMMRFSKVITWILLGLDFFIVIWWFIKYMPGYIKRFWNLIKGVKSTLSRFF